MTVKGFESSNYFNMTSRTESVPGEGLRNGHRWDLSTILTLCPSFALYLSFVSISQDGKLCYQ